MTSDYADSGDYTYVPRTERVLVRSMNWPADVNAEMERQRAENVRLEECNAWLENEVRSLRAEMELLNAKVSGIARRLGRLAGLVEGRTNDSQ